LQLEEVIKENKNRINKERIKLEELNRKLINLNNDVYFYFNKCRLKDLRNDLLKKENEISELNLYIPLQIKEKLMSITIISSDENIHFSIICHNKDNFSKIEELLYNKYPQYKNDYNCFFLKGKIIEKNNSLENNNIKDNDLILLQ
jgi:hypothetical protein